MHRDKFHSNAENNIIHTFYEKLRDLSFFLCVCVCVCVCVGGGGGSEF